MTEPRNRDPEVVSEQMPTRVLVIQLTPTPTLLNLLPRLRERWPTAQFCVLTALRETAEQLGPEMHNVLCTAGLGVREVVRRVRGFAPDLVMLAGGEDYGLGPSYFKAVLLSRLSGARWRRQWEPVGQREFPLTRGVMASVARAARSWARSGGAARDRLLRRRDLRYYQRPPTRGPRLVQLGITHACNYHCLMCPFHNPVVDREHVESQLPRLSYQLFAQLIRDLARSGTQKLEMTGHGEPLTHPDAMEMVACAVQQGLEVTLKTNGSLLTEAKVKRFVDLGLPRLHVSLNASTEETYAKIHPGTPPGRLSAIVENLRLMAEYARETGQPPVGVEISAVLNRLNMGELPGLVEVCRLARADALALIVMAPSPSQPDLALRPEDWLAIPEAIREVRRLGDELGIRILPRELEATADETLTRSIYELIPCYMGHEFTQILGTGEVRFCAYCWDLVGNIHEKPFPAIWRSEAYARMRVGAMALPQTRKPPGRLCGCFQGCCHVAGNLEVHRHLYGNDPLEELG